MHDITTLLRNADPGAETAPYTEDQRAVILARAVAPVTPPRRRLGIRIGAVAAATLVVIGIGTSNLATPSISARAEEVLTEAAINAKDPVTKPGQYWRITTSSTGVAQVDHGDRGSAECRWIQERTEFVSVDGATASWFVDEGGWVREAADPLCDQEDDGRQVWTTDIAPNDGPSGWASPSRAFLDSLPRDPSPLRARIYAETAGHGRDPDSEVFVTVADLLRSGRVPADLRASLFDVLRTLPGINVVDDTVVDGRQVVVLTIGDVHGTVEQMIVDPQGGEVAGERRVGADGQVYHESHTSREVVDQVPADIRAEAVHQDCTLVDGGAIVCE